MEEKTNLFYCDVIKNTMMLLVVAYHSMALWNRNIWLVPPLDPAPYFTICAAFFNNLHIYTFTFASGYIFYFTRFERTSKSNFYESMINRIKQLIIPYIAGALLWCVWFDISIDSLIISDVVHKYILAENPSQLWFLLMLFNVFCITLVFKDFFRKQKAIVGVSVCLVLYLIGLVLGKISPNLFQFQTALKFLIFYYLGFKYRQFKSEKHQLPANSVLLMACFEIILFGISYYLDGLQGLNSVMKVGEMAINLLLHINGPLLVFAFCENNAEKIQCLLANSVVHRWLKQRSYLIYIFHQQMVYIVVFLLNGKTHPIVLFLISFSICILVAGTIASIILKIKTLRILFTGRT